MTRGGHGLGALSAGLCLACGGWGTPGEPPTVALPPVAVPTVPAEPPVLPAAPKAPRLPAVPRDPTAETFPDRIVVTRIDAPVDPAVPPTGEPDAPVDLGPPPTDVTIDAACTTDSPAIDSAVHRFAGQLRSCYLERARSRPELHGTVEFGFTSADGRANDVQIIANDTGDSGMATCVADHVPRWGMPPTAPGPATCVLTFTPVP